MRALPYTKLYVFFLTYCACSHASKAPVSKPNPKPQTLNYLKPQILNPYSLNPLNPKPENPKPQTRIDSATQTCTPRGCPDDSVLPPNRLWRFQSVQGLGLGGGSPIAEDLTMIHAVIRLHPLKPASGGVGGKEWRREWEPM